MPQPQSSSSSAVMHEVMHREDRAWHQRMHRLREWLRSKDISPARTVVLVPYAQLMATARQAWARSQPSGFAPRFESTRNWAANLMPFAPGPTDWSGDVARDSLVAGAFVERVVQVPAGGELRAAMGSRLVEATRSLAPWAAALKPQERIAWGHATLEALSPGLHSPAWEGLIATLAITWAGNSAFATDVLWGSLAAPGASADALVVFQGFQLDPLAEALAKQWGAERSQIWRLHDPIESEMEAESVKPLHLHACGDAEDEAQRAAACVVRQVEAGRTPVALVANDRLLTRRVSAVLSSVGLPVRDETGWKLSTTFVGAQLMALLRAADPRASMDEVIDALKLAPAWAPDSVDRLEFLARRHGVAFWRAALAHPELSHAVPGDWRDVLAGLQKARPLVSWLHALAQALAVGGWWSSMSQDAAGQQLLAALRLGSGSGAELASLGFHETEMQQGGFAQRWSLSAFTAWVAEVLEGASFTAAPSTDPSVVILPMAQLVGRAFAAIVVPGCDERSLPTHPEPPSPWTGVQLQALGLPGREALGLAALQAWQALLPNPQVDILWRTQDRGEATMANVWVLALLAAGGQLSLDPRADKVFHTSVPIRPAPSAAALLPDRLSASAYQDLRDCPYRFFALRQLRLQDADELEEEPDQRDMGNWLHAVLRGFHEERGDQRPGRTADTEALERWAQSVGEAMGLYGEEGQAGFLPFRAVWPAMREGYLDWLADFESLPDRAGPAFEAAEVERNAVAGRWRLLGKLDRVDAQPSPEGRLAVVIDYKTESRERTLDRVKHPMEDTQLAFYAALLPEENLRAAYLSITDKCGSGRSAATLLVEQPEVLLAREALLRGLESDMERVAAGHAMPALGEGKACEFCAARGLCRRDDWSAT
jgi:ATP-dependent helicase/nuclease subunit B